MYISTLRQILESGNKATCLVVIASIIFKEKLSHQLLKFLIDNKPVSNEYTNWLSWYFNEIDEPVGRILSFFSFILEKLHPRLPIVHAFLEVIKNNPEGKQAVALKETLTLFDNKQRAEVINKFLALRLELGIELLMKHGSQGYCEHFFQSWLAEYLQAGNPRTFFANGTPNMIMQLLSQEMIEGRVYDIFFGTRENSLIWLGVLLENVCIDDFKPLFNKVCEIHSIATENIAQMNRHSHRLANFKKLGIPKVEASCTTKTDSLPNSWREFNDRFYCLARAINEGRTLDEINREEEEARKKPRLR